MVYTSRSDLESAMGVSVVLDLVDDERGGSMGAAQEARVTAAIVQASGEIDGYLCARYLLPLTEVPPMVAVIAVDLAIYYLHRRRHASFGMPESVLAAYERRIKQLEAINQGKLDVGAATPPVSAGNFGTASDGPAQEFTNASLRRF